MQPHFIKAWTNRGHPIRTVSFSSVLSWQTFPPARPSLSTSFQKRKSLVSASQCPKSMTISELVANTLIGVDTCAISTDADALTIHPLQLIQKANGYPAKETRKRNLQHLLFMDHCRCSIYETVYDDPPVSSARRYESHPMDCHSCRNNRHVL